MEGIGEGYKRIGKKWRSRREWGEDLVLAGVCFVFYNELADKRRRERKRTRTEDMLK